MKTTNTCFENEFMDAFYLSYLLMPLTILLAILPWESVFNLPDARTFLLPLAGGLMVAGFAEGTYQAVMMEETMNQKVFSWLSAVAHIIPFLLLVLLSRPAGDMTQWKGALLLGTIFAVLLSIVLIIPYMVYDNLPYCMDYFGIAFSYAAGILLALIVGEKTSSTGLFKYVE